MPWKAAEPKEAIAAQPEEADLDQARRQERDAARLAWLERPSRSLSLAVKWRRYYQMWPALALVRLLPELEVRCLELAQLVAKPPDYITGETWTRAAERLEELQGQVTAVRSLLRR